MRGATLVRALVCVTALGCARTEYLVVKVARADAVALESVEPSTGLVPDYDLDHPRTVLPAGGAPIVELAPYRTGTAQARRNADGSIELVFAEGTWPLVRADGTVTPLRSDAYVLPETGSAWGFLGRPPTPPGGRTPWQLRLVTPRDNVTDARLAIRRDRVSGVVYLSFAALCAGLSAAAIYAGANADAGQRAVPFVIGGAGLALTSMLAVQGLSFLLVRERDEVLVHDDSRQ